MTPLNQGDLKVGLHIRTDCGCAGYISSVTGDAFVIDATRRCGYSASDIKVALKMLKAGNPIRVAFTFRSHAPYFIEPEPVMPDSMESMKQMELF